MDYTQHMLHCPIQLLIFVGAVLHQSLMLATFHMGTHLVLESRWLHHLQGSAVHLDQAIPPLAVSNCCGGFL